MMKRSHTDMSYISVDMSRNMTKPTKWLCVQRSLWSDWADAQISLGIRPVWSAFTLRLMGSSGPKLSSCWQQRLWSDWADALADLSVHWVPSFCWFCHVAAHMSCRQSFRLISLPHGASGSAQHWYNVPYAIMHQAKARNNIQLCAIFVAHL